MCAALRRLRSEGTLAHVGLGMNCNREAHQGVPHEVIRLLREVRSFGFLEERVSSGSVGRDMLEGSSGGARCGGTVSCRVLKVAVRRRTRSTIAGVCLNGRLGC